MYASRIYKLIKLGLSIEDQEDKETKEEELPKLEGEKMNEMEEVD